MKLDSGTNLMSLLNAVPEAHHHLRAAESLLKMRNEKVWLMMPYGVRIR